MNHLSLNSAASIAPRRLTGSVAGTGALLFSYCAGMLDLVALPVWVGTLVGRYGFDPQRAGALATLFLVGAVAASVIVSPRLNVLNARTVAAGSYALAAIAFLLCSTRSDFLSLGFLHAAAGLAVGTALSMVVGTMGKSLNPHRLFAMAAVALGLFAIMMLGALPIIIVAFGGPALFVVLAAILLIAALSCFFCFPHTSAPDAQTMSSFDRAIWFAFAGLSLMSFNQAMVFSFLDVIARARGFELGQIQLALVVLGVVNCVLPAPLAALLQHRVSAIRIAQVGPVLQAALALVVTSSSIYAYWLPATAVFVAVQIFTHVFIFGLLAKLDPSGRATAATPALLLTGAALGPIAGGSLANGLGFSALGLAAVGVAALAILSFTLAKTR